MGRDDRAIASFLGAAAVFMVGCSGGQARVPGAKGAAIHGLEIDQTDEELSTKVPIVLVGTTLANTIGKFKERGDLKPALDGEERRLIDADYRYNQWTVRIDAQIKGSIDSPALTFAPADQGDGRVSLDAAETVRLPQDGLVVGRRYKFWLTPNEAFITPVHFVIVRARESI